MQSIHWSKKIQLRIKASIVSCALCGILMLLPDALIAAENVIVERPTDQRVFVPNSEAENSASVAAEPISASANSNVVATESQPENPLWDLHNQLTQLQEQLQILQGVVEEQAHQLEVLDNQQKEHYIDLDQRMNELKKTGPTATPSTNHTNAANAAPVDEQAFFSEKQRYQVAQDFIKARKLEDAKRALAQYLKEFPKGIFAANAHYWLGEINLVSTTPDLDQAQYHFSYIVQNYPTHTKIPAALYKLGTIYNMQGQPAKAKNYFNRVIQQYPDSSAAQLAKNSLK